MRTRRIAIGCRRTGWASTVAIAPSPGLAGAPDPASAEFPPIDLTPQPDLGRTQPDLGRTQPDLGRTPSSEAGRTPSLEAPPAAPTPVPAWIPATAHAAQRVPTPSAPSPGEQDLTLADFTTCRRDLSWNDNPGWPDRADVDWTRIARGHTPRHARRHLPTIPFRAFTWTGAGIITAVLLTVLVTTISELIP